MNQLSPQQCFQQLSSLLQRQSADLDSINAYLSDIKSAIADGETELLSQLLTNQRLPFAEMDDLESQRHKLLKLYGFETDKESLLACVQWCDQSTKLYEQYQKFENSLLRLQHSIQLNSLLVNKGQQRVRQSLHLLTGQPSTNNARTYSSTGQTEDLNNKRTIAQV